MFKPAVRELVMFAQLEASIRNGLDDFGVHRINRGFEDLVRLGETYVEGLVHEGIGERVQDSLLPLEYTEPRPGKVLCIDIGGSNVRAALREVGANGEDSWRILHASPVAALDFGSAGTPLARFGDNLFDLIRRSWQHSARLDGLAVVWSNALSSCILPTSAGVQGVNGTVLNPEGLSTKSEFFLEGLEHGHDLGHTFLNQAANHSLLPKNFVIANDVPFCLKYPFAMQAHGSIVASTGANGSIVIDGKICNPEIGVQFKIPAEHLFLPEAESGQRCFQDLCCGKSLGRSLSELVIALSQRRDLTPLRPLAEALQSGADSLNAVDISLLLGVEFDRFREKRTTTGLSDEVCGALYGVAKALQERASKAAALMAYLSVYNQLEFQSEPCTVVVESSLARGMPFFKEEMIQAARQISAAQVQLMFPPALNLITTPMVGAARALDHWL